MKLSIIIPVLNSHEIVRRQILHWQRIGLPEGVEILLMDDGSDPPITGEMPGLRIIPTHDTRPWTWAVARNTGARISEADYYLMTDLDYILPREALEAAVAFDGHKMRFRRQFGVLTETGMFTQDVPTLLRYGLDAGRVRRKGLHMPPHPNNFVMRRDIFWMLGGYREDRIGKPYPQGEDSMFKREWMRALAKGTVQDHDVRPWIYMFPNGQFCGDVDHNPFGLFHDLSRKSGRNPWEGVSRA